MNVLLDTSIQIDRALASHKRRQTIAKILTDQSCYSSTYVLGEFKSNIVNDFCTMAAIISQETDLNEAERRITEKAFGRQKDRMHKIFTDLREQYFNDIELVKTEIDDYPRRLLKKFFYGIHDNLLNETNCARAKAEIDFTATPPIMKGIRCRLSDDQCEICTFCKKHSTALSTVATNDNIDLALSQVLTSIISKEKAPKGNNCRTMGDIIICMETMALQNPTVCSSNKKDFEPICYELGLEFIYPDYSDTSQT